MNAIRCDVWRLDEIPEAEHLPYFLYETPASRGQPDFISRVIEVVGKRFGGGRYQIRIAKNMKYIKFMTFEISGSSKYLENCICDKLTLLQIGCECGGL